MVLFSDLPKEKQKFYSCEFQTKLSKAIYKKSCIAESEKEAKKIFIDYVNKLNDVVLISHSFTKYTEGQFYLCNLQSDYILLK